MVLLRRKRGIHLTAHKSRQRQAKRREATHCQSGGSGKARLCPRCHQRTNNCTARGCLPFKLPLCEQNLVSVEDLLNELSKSSPARRYATDCSDVQVMVHWMTRSQKAYGTKQSVLGVTIAAHFGNQLRTLGYVVPHIKARMNWCGMRDALEHNYNNFGSSHSRNCMSGTGFTSSSSGDYFMKFSEGFRSVYEHASFRKACNLLESVVSTHEQYDDMYSLFGQVQDSVHGSFCGYHFKLALDHLVSAGWILPSAVTKWPVATTSGTAHGLNRLCKTKVKSPKLLSEMLNELLVRLRNRGKLTWKDFAGTIGAALCWAKRKNAWTLSQNYFLFRHGVVAAFTGRIITGFIAICSVAFLVSTSSRVLCCTAVRGLFKNLLDRLT